MKDRRASWGQPAALIVAAGATTALFWATDLDLRVSGLFHRPGSAAGPWPDAGRPIWVVLHRLTPWLAVALAATGVAMMIAGRWRAAWRPLTTQGLLVVLGLALGPGLLVNVILKPQARRPRPLQTVTLGGDHRYVPPLAGGPHGKSFPCGDASVGFMVGVFGCVLRRRSPSAARTAVGTAVVLGLVIGLARIAAGAHFLSDVLWAGLCVWGTLLALDRMLARVANARVGARRRATLSAAGVAALGVVLLSALPFEQVIDRSWAPASGAAGAEADAPWRIEMRLETGSARVIFEPGAHPADTGAVLWLGGRLRGFAAPWARVRAQIEERPERRIVRVIVRPHGWFTRLRGTMEVRLAADVAAETGIEVPDGVLTLVAAPGVASLPVVITRTRGDALRLRGVRPDQVRAATPPILSGAAR